MFGGFLKCRERLCAGGIHFILSLIVVFLFWLVARFSLYPGVLSAFGLYDGFVILFVVDLILGPLLTILIYDIRKKSLKFDLCVIVSLQLCAFIFGASLVYSQKPCVMVLSHEGVVVHTVADCREYKIGSQFRSHIGSVPLVSMDLPKSLEEINAVRFVTEFMEGKPLTTRSDLYVPISELPGDQLDFYLSDREYLEDEKCHVVPLISEHLDGKTCVDLESSRLKKVMR